MYDTHQWGDLTCSDTQRLLRGYLDESDSLLCDNLCWRERLRPKQRSLKMFALNLVKVYFQLGCYRHLTLYHNFLHGKHLISCNLCCRFVPYPLMWWSTPKSFRKCRPNVFSFTESPHCRFSVLWFSIQMCFPSLLNIYWLTIRPPDFPSSWTGRNRFRIPVGDRCLFGRKFSCQLY